MPICTLSWPGPFRVGLLVLLRLSNIGGGDARLRRPNVDDEYFRDAEKATGIRARPWRGEGDGDCGESGGMGGRQMGRRLDVDGNGSRRWWEASTRDTR
jgi:hypothetical protein